MAKKRKASIGKRSKSKKSKSKPVGQPQRRMCATMGMHYSLLETDPGYRARQMEIETLCRTMMNQKMAMPKKANKVQCVVHVLHNSAAENISDAQIKSQIKVLNEDFRATNADVNQVPSVWTGLVGDSMIEFELAKKTPSGTATTGITRANVDSVSFRADDSMKSTSSGGVDPWDTKKYLNIWVCTLGGGLLGYAQFPGGPASTDGVVILNTAFGTSGTASAPFDQGRTTSHEVGHYFNLRHIWGDDSGCTGSDFVPDTPNAATPNYGNPNFPSISCSNSPNGDMFMNYMDYVDDAAMFMFTKGQVARMRATLSGPRKDLI